MIKNARIAAINVNSLDYHAGSGVRGNPGFIMSSSQLRLFGECPQKWRDGYTVPDSKAKRWGNLIDCLLLTPTQFPERYAVQPAQYATTVNRCPGCGSESDAKSCRKCGLERESKTVFKDWNNGADVCRNWVAERNGKEIVTHQEHEDACVAIIKLTADPKIVAFLMASDRQVHIVAEWHDEETGLVIPLQCLLDLVPRLGTDFEQYIGDLKTTKNAGLRKWRNWAIRQAQYHVQMGFGMDMYLAAVNADAPIEDRNTACFIVQENYSPWTTGKRMLGQNALAGGRARYAKLLADYCQCLKRNVWPDYDMTDEAVDGWSIVDMDENDAFSEQFGPKLQFEEQEAEEETEESDVPH